MTPPERTAWLRARQSGVGGTDIASIAGVGFQSAADVYAEKLAPDPIDREPSPIMLMGLATEDHNAALYTKRTGTRLMSPGLVRSKREPFVFATLDRVSLHPDSGLADKPVQLKYAGPFFGDSWGADGTDEIKDGYLVQVTWEALVVQHNGQAAAEADLSALDGAGEHRVYRVPFDPRLATMLLELAAAFWRRVEYRDGIEGWTHPIQAEVVNRLESLRPDVSVELDEAALSQVCAFQAAKEREKEAKRAADEFKAELLKALAGAGEGRLPDGQRITQKIVHRRAYSIEASSYVDFRVHKPRKAKV